MNTLYFEKISQFDRSAEPVMVSIPFAKGKLADPQQLVIRDGDWVLPIQRRILATYEDGSVKWLLVHFQPDLPGNAYKTMHFEIAEAASDLQPDVPVTVTETPAGVAIDTGPLSFRIPREGFWPIVNVQLNGEALSSEPFFSGFTLTYDGQQVGSASSPVELEIEEAGPLRAVVLIRGKHRKPDGEEYLDLRGRVTVYAGKPYVEVEHQFIHAEEEGVLELEQLLLEFRPQASGTPHLALGQGYYRTNIDEIDDPSPDDALEMTLDAETMLYQSNEHYVDCFYGDFWVDWRDERAGLTLSVYQAHQNFPKKLRVEGDGIVCSLYPTDVPAAPVLQGMAKTHRLQLRFHGPDTPLEECSTRSLQFQLHDRPALSRAWYRENNPWVEAFFPEEVPSRLITRLSLLSTPVMGVRQTPKGHLPYVDITEDTRRPSQEVL